MRNRQTPIESANDSKYDAAHQSDAAQAPMKLFKM